MSDRIEQPAAHTLDQPAALAPVTAAGIAEAAERVQNTQSEESFADPVAGSNQDVDPAGANASELKPGTRSGSRQNPFF